MSQVRIDDCAWEWFTDALLINSAAATVLFVGYVISLGYQADCWDQPVFKVEMDLVRAGDRGAFINLLNAMHEHREWRTRDDYEQEPDLPKAPVPGWFTAVKELASTHNPVS